MRQIDTIMLNTGYAEKTMEPFGDTSDTGHLKIMLISKNAERISHA